MVTKGCFNQECSSTHLSAPPTLLSLTHSIKRREEGSLSSYEITNILCQLRGSKFQVFQDNWLINIKQCPFIYSHSTDQDLFLIQEYSFLSVQHAGLLTCLIQQAYRWMQNVLHILVSYQFDNFGTGWKSQSKTNNDTHH